MNALLAPQLYEDEIDLSPIQDGRMSAPLLPLDLFGAAAPWISAIAEMAVAPNDYVAAALLSAASGAIGNARTVRAWDGWTECVVLWVGNVGDPSSSKSPAAEFVLSGLRRVEADEVRAFAPELQKYETQKEIAEAAAASWKDTVRAMMKNGETPPDKPPVAIVPPQPQAPRCIMGDATPEALASALSSNKRGLLSTRDELVGWLSMDRYSSGGERPFWLEAYGGRAYTVDRKSSAPISIEHLSIAVFGGLQPDRFANLIAGGDDDGLASRFLWVWPEPRPFARPKKIADTDTIYNVFKLLRGLPMGIGEHGPYPIPVRLSDEAAHMLEGWCREDEVTCRDGSILYRSWRGKGRGHVLRLSLVLEFLEWAFTDGATAAAPTTISETMVIRAIALYSDYFVPMAQRVFGGASLGPEERDAGAIARHIVDQRLPSISLRDVYRGRIGGIATADRARLAVEVLVDALWLEDAATRKGDTPGRKKGLYRVNPELWGALT